ncbi:MAG TPA: hypothetical protein VH459_11880 [Gaiellales bacterium]|jgi:hypothetical protein
MRDRASEHAGGWRHARIVAGLVFIVGLLDGLVVATGTAQVELIAAVALGVALYGLIDWLRPKR